MTPEASCLHFVVHVRVGTSRTHANIRQLQLSRSPVTVCAYIPANLLNAAICRPDATRRPPVEAFVELVSSDMKEESRPPCANRAYHTNRYEILLVEYFTCCSSERAYGMGKKANRL